MTANQTIDGVPRDLLELAAKQLLFYGRELVAQELRTLLDADKVNNRQLGLVQFVEAHPIKPAAQPQGVPVARVHQSPVRKYLSVELLRTDMRDGDLLYAEQPAPFQSRVHPWMLKCFGEAIAADRQERNHRFLEEALELVQANQCTASEAHQLVDYAYSRPVGEPSQEVGGVMVTLAALCLASGLDMHAAAETELSRIWTKVDQIRAKQAAKPAMSPLPGVYPDREQPAPVAAVLPDPATAQDFGDESMANG